MLEQARERTVMMRLDADSIVILLDACCWSVVYFKWRSPGAIVPESWVHEHEDVRRYVCISYAVPMCRKPQWHFFADYAAGISFCGISSYVERLCGRSSEVFRMCRYKRTPHFSRDTLCLPMLRKLEGCLPMLRNLEGLPSTLPQQVVDRRCDVFFTTLKELCIGDEDDGILH